MKIRYLRPNDRAACLAVFDGNAPEYFHPSERAAFADCLDSDDYRPPRLRGAGGPKGMFYVVEDDDEIIGCGGWYLDGDVAVLSWGMVERSSHRQGIGRFLLRERLNEIRLDPRIKSVRVRTTAPVRGFFEREGFRGGAEPVPGLVDEVPLVELNLMLPSEEGTSAP